MTTTNVANQESSNQPNQNSTIVLDISAKLDDVTQKLDESKTQLANINAKLETINTGLGVIANTINKPETVTEHWIFRFLGEGFAIGIAVAFFGVMFSGLFEPFFNLWSPSVPIKVSAIEITINGNKGDEKKIACEFVYQRAKACEDEQGNSVLLNSIAWPENQSLTVEIAIWDDSPTKYADKQILCKWQSQEISMCKYENFLTSEEPRTLNVLIYNAPSISEFNYFPQVQMNFVKLAKE